MFQKHFGFSIAFQLADLPFYVLPVSIDMLEFNWEIFRQMFGELEHTVWRQCRIVEHRRWLSIGKHQPHHSCDPPALLRGRSPVKMYKDCWLLWSSKAERTVSVSCLGRSEVTRFYPIGVAPWFSSNNRDCEKEKIKHDRNWLRTPSRGRQTPNNGRRSPRWTNAYYLVQISFQI